MNEEERLARLECELRDVKTRMTRIEEICSSQEDQIASYQKEILDLQNKNSSLIERTKEHKITITGEDSARLDQKIRDLYLDPKNTCQDIADKAGVSFQTMIGRLGKMFKSGVLEPKYKNRRISP